MVVNGGSIARRTVAVAVFGALVSCGSNEGASGTLVYSGSTGGTGGAACVQSSCTCSDGRTGVRDCGADACSCDNCPDFTADNAPPFAACGGEFLGTWDLVSVDTSGVELHLFKVDILTGLMPEGTCPVQLVAQPVKPELRFRLLKNGSGEIVLGGLAITYQALTSCIQGVLGASQSCAGLKNCGSQSCGICRCSEEISSLNDENAFWSASGSTLTIGPRSFEYCAQGTTLELRETGTGIRFVMQRVYTMGNCQLDDYGVVAGCQLLTTRPSCVGTPQPCSAQPNYMWCQSVAGCTAAAACVGGSHACQDFYDTIPGCTCDGHGRCYGNYTCELLSSSICTSASGCQWDSDACLGTPTPCASLAPEDCELMTGCALQAN